MHCTMCCTSIANLLHRQRQQQEGPKSLDFIKKDKAKDKMVEKARLVKNGPLRCEEMRCVIVSHR